MAYRLPHPEARPPTLDPKEVPEAFRHLIPLAEKYGISDDCYLDDVIDSLDDSELRECASFLGSYNAVLTDWLAGPAAAGPEFSKEYTAFSALGMAADLAKLRLDRMAGGRRLGSREPDT